MEIVSGLLNSKISLIVNVHSVHEDKKGTAPPKHVQHDREGRSVRGITSGSKSNLLSPFKPNSGSPSPLA